MQITITIPEDIINYCKSLGVADRDIPQAYEEYVEHATNVHANHIFDFQMWLRHSEDYIPMESK